MQFFFFLIFAFVIFCYTDTYIYFSSAPLMLPDSVDVNLINDISM